MKTHLLAIDRETDDYRALCGTTSGAAGVFCTSQLAEVDCKRCIVSMEACATRARRGRK
jgi:hypothetical protein